MTDRYQDTIPSNYCPDCCSTIEGYVLPDNIRDCSDHLSHEHLVESYKWLLAKHKKLQASLDGLVKEVAVDNTEKKIIELTEKIHRMNTRIYELESRCRYKEAYIEELTESIKEATQTMRKASELMNQEPQKGLEETRG